MRRKQASPRKTKYDAVIATPVGRWGIIMENDVLIDIDFLKSSIPLQAAHSLGAQRVCRQLRSYFANPKVSFRLSLAPSGTSFQQRVWKALQRIPTGQTLSYGALAQKLATSARAVGNACRANPIPIIIPCHRIVAANGAGGFMGKRAGPALRLKHWLLKHEQRR